MAYPYGGLFSLLIHFSKALSGTSIASGAWGTCMKHLFERTPHVYIVQDVEGVSPYGPVAHVVGDNIAEVPAAGRQWILNAGHSIH